MKYKIVLASNSKQRKDILNMIGLKYEVVVSDIDEDSDKKIPEEYVMELSKNKVMNVRKKINNKRIIIGADTIIYYNNKIYEKPKTKEEAYINLKDMSGNITTAITGITIYDMYKDKIISFYDKCDIKFKKISKEEINWYVNSEKNILSRCGYVILGKASLFLEKVNGDYNTILGLSPSILFNNLKKLEYDINDFEWIV